MLGMVIEGLVIALLLLTIGYCVALNRRLARLRTGEQTMREVIGELIASTEGAQRAIHDLRETTEATDQRLGHKLKQGDALLQELGQRVAAGEAVVERISRLAMAAGVEQSASARAPEPRPLGAGRRNRFEDDLSFLTGDAA